MSEDKLPVSKATLHQSPPGHVAIGVGTKTSLTADELPEGVRMFWDSQGLWWSKKGVTVLFPAPGVSCVRFLTSPVEEVKVVKKAVKVNQATA